MRIGKRLEKVLSLIDEDLELVVDVGTDHGYLALKAIENRGAKKVIASDISAGSLKKAKALAEKYGLEPKIDCVLSDGLEAFGEDFWADLVVIAGMGGNETVKIIKNVKNLKNIKCFILQPMQDVEVLREFLYQAGFSIIIDETVKDRDKYYHVIKCVYEGIPKTPSLRELIVGITDSKTKTEDFVSYIKDSVQALEARINYLNRLDKEKFKVYTNILSTISKINRGKKNNEKHVKVSRN